jgi:UDP-glucose 6-dehydrogenase
MRDAVIGTGYVGQATDDVLTEYGYDVTLFDGRSLYSKALADQVGHEYFTIGG